MAYHAHPAGELMLPEEVHDGLQGNHSGLGHGIPVNPGGDGWKIHCLHAVPLRQKQAGAVAGGQQRRLPGVPAPPDGTRGVEDVLRGEAIALGQLGLPGLAAPQGAALRQQVRPGGAVDGPVHAAAPQERAVGGVDNSLRVGLGDIAHEDGKTVHIGALLGLRFGSFI